MRDSIRKDRARIQIGRISNFGLLEMTRQRLREGSIKWETQLSLGSFSQKILKKIQLLAFSGKVKIIRTHIPEKVIMYIKKIFSDELKYFEKKYSFKIEFLPDEKLVIPEYKIELLNKSKKVLNKIENIENFWNLSDRKTNSEKAKKETKKSKKTSKKTIVKKKLRTLWVRRKKTKSNP